METLIRGAVAEAAVFAAVVKRGLPGLVPVGQSLSYDLAVPLPDGLFLRIQCKNARLRGGCLLFNSCTTDHGRDRQDYVGLAA